MTKPANSNIPILFFLSSLIIFWVTAPTNPTPYDYFTRLADAFLQGRIHLTENPEWLNELIPAGKHIFYVPYPPMPALLAVPLRLLFPFPQQWIAHILGAGTVALSVILSQIYIQKSTIKHIWIGLFVGFSTVLWFLSSVGSSWYLGQVSSVFFLTAALIAAYRERAFVSGLLLGAAYLSRIHVIASVPVLLYLLWKQRSSKKIIVLFFTGIAPFVLFNIVYNLARFGVPWDQAYALIPGVLDEPWYTLGLVHPSYISRHVEVLVTALPHFQQSFPYVIPKWSGLALWITTPAIIFTFLAPMKQKLTRVTWLSILLVAAPILMHGTNGFAQFGYRFFIDLLPLFTMLMCISLKKNQLTRLHWILVIIGILVNFWGVLWINKFGWVVV